MGCQLTDEKIQMLIWMNFRYSPVSWNKKSQPSWQEKWYGRLIVWESNDSTEKRVTTNMKRERCHSKQYIQYIPNWTLFTRNCQTNYTFRIDKIKIFWKNVIKDKTSFTAMVWFSADGYILPIDVVGNIKQLQ